MGSTVTRHSATSPEPSAVEAVMIASPTLNALILPLLSTCVTEGTELLKRMAGLVTSAGKTSAVKRAESPMVRVSEEAEIASESARTGVIITAQDALRFEPSSVETVTVAAPRLRAVQKPSESTETMVESELVQQTAGLVVLAGSTVQESENVPATWRVVSVREIRSDSARIGLT